MSIGTVSEFAEIEEYAKPGQEWQCYAHIETPEEAFWRKEAERERRAALTEKQREVYELYYEKGFNEIEIGHILGISRSAVRDRMECIRQKLRKDFEKYF
jgi:RNA polymerase sigma factor (sigma-70 family)